MRLGWLSCVCGRCDKALFTISNVASLNEGLQVRSCITCVPSSCFGCAITSLPLHSSTLNLSPTFTIFTSIPPSTLFHLHLYSIFTSLPLSLPLLPPPSPPSPPPPPPYPTPDPRQSEVHMLPKIIFFPEKKIHTNIGINEGK